MPPTPPILILLCFPAQEELTNGRSKFHILFLLFVAIMFFVSLMFLFGYHCWLVSRNRSTLGEFLSALSKGAWLGSWFADLTVPA